MNECVRTYLIEAAREKDKFVYYSDVVRSCALDINISTEWGRKQLSEVLGEVSIFESSQIPSRPLLSSLAIYKDSSKNDHGDGFYRLAEQLGKGSFKELKDELYGFTEAERCRRFWQNENNYVKFLPLNAHPETDVPKFFNQVEIDFFMKWQGRSYDPNNKEHTYAKNFLMNSIWEKNIYLGREIVRQVEGFELDGKKIWQQRSWKENRNGDKVPAVIFKTYTWVKIFRNTDKGKDIFFTFGIEAYPDVKAFIFKIDCQDKKGSKLNRAQIDLCKSLIPESAKWNKIAFDDLLTENWDSLITKCVNFVNAHLAQYDAIVNAVWGEAIPSILFKNKLIQREKPMDGYTMLPEANKSFKGIDVDFEGKAKEHKDLGDAGEALVKQHEILFLRNRGWPEKAALVKIVRDGEGYDVFSFNEAGNEKYIEVKTTTGNEYSPFYMSHNELLFMQRNEGQYCIYRVYNYNSEDNFGEFFELKGDVKRHLLMKPIQFQVLIRKEE